MNEATVITGDIRSTYRDQGYIVLPELIPREQLTRLRDAAGTVVEAFDIRAHRNVFTTRDNDRGRDDYFFASSEAVHCFLEADALDARGELCKPKHLAINKIGHALHDHLPAYTYFCRQLWLGQILRKLELRRPQIWQTMYIFKQPQIGGEVRWHQDATYLLTNPQAVTGIWLALEDAHRENGCLWVQPGGHRSPLRERYEVDWESRRGTLTTLDPTPWPSLDQAVPLEVKAGTVVVFHDHLPHYSATNRSATSRHALTIHVADADVAWCTSNWLQRQHLDPFFV